MDIISNYPSILTVTLTGQEIEDLTVCLLHERERLRKAYQSNWATVKEHRQLKLVNAILDKVS